ncbi:hypothetical protein AMAG_01822 [Allomyces macrogynus ATCC 38327]|uniref:Mitochondrial glycine transporter n=1 Tax=Allomyces macrogynus (strain ATCC 38327) TaxID=578462 RepID=A0A0L0S0T9_ALLM3|nr:hypothetical protein AMAG_01822 [Allomyces macrogynus ATCC 38327]|eukprot:KNE55976.1 hypothetical protein AMAG_01822 [Allomyces macrogynus ATCC 38327]
MSIPAAAATATNAAPLAAAALAMATSPTSNAAITAATTANPTTTPTTRPKPPPAIHLLGGALSGMTTCIALQPLDVVKTRLQQEAAHHGTVAANAARHAGSLSALQARIAKFHALGVSGQVRVITKQIVDERGVQGLWRGTTPTILRNVPGSAFYFFFLHHLRSTFAHLPWLSRDSANMVAGATARGTAGLLFMPISVIKVRYESSAYAYTSIAGAARDIVAKEGVRGLFAGFGATAMRDVPYAGVYVALYEQLKALGNRVLLDSSPAKSTGLNMGSGVIAGTFATVLTQPFDLIKTRVQVDPHHYPNSWVAIRKIFSAEGLRGFFSGMSPRLVRKPLHAAITWTVYEEVVAIWNGGLHSIGAHHHA